MKKRFWTPEEITLLKEHYPRLGIDIKLTKIIPQHTLRAIWIKASRLKIKSGVKAQKCRLHKFGDANSEWMGDSASEHAGRVRTEHLYKCPLLKWMRLERHHVDGNTKNNIPENIQFLTVRDHMIIDGRMERLRKGLVSRGIIK